MITQELFLILAILIPLVIIPLFGYKKNPIYFIIGLQLAFYIGHNFYETYLSLNLYDINATNEVKLKAIEAGVDVAFSREELESMVGNVQLARAKKAIANQIQIRKEEIGILKEQLAMIK